MIYMKLHEYGNMLQTGLQRTFIICSNQSLTKFLFERYNINMIQAIHILQLYEQLSTSSCSIMSILQMRSSVDVGEQARYADFDVQEKRNKTHFRQMHLALTIKASFCSCFTIFHKEPAYQI